MANFVITTMLVVLGEIFSYSYFQLTCEKNVLAVIIGKGLGIRTIG